MIVRASNQKRNKNQHLFFFLYFSIPHPKFTLKYFSDTGLVTVFTSFPLGSAIVIFTCLLTFSMECEQKFLCLYIRIFCLHFQLSIKVRKYFSFI